jgi:hypothetical protein
VAIVLNLIPFAGIAFLWFIGVLRGRIGEREDRFFATVFLGRGLLFVATMFVAAAFAAGLIADMPSAPPDASTRALGRHITSILLNVYWLRMAAVFTLTTVTIARRTEIVSRWLTMAGLATTLVQLVAVGISPSGGVAIPCVDPGIERRHSCGRPEGRPGHYGNSTLGLIALRDNLGLLHRRYRR